MHPPNPQPNKPPVVLIHGAANSSLVWKFWQQSLASNGWATLALDLRGHGKRSNFDLSRATMFDYADDVTDFISIIRGGGLAKSFTRRTKRVLVSRSPEYAEGEAKDLAPILLGWSMGGLVAMMAAARNQASACIALAPSLPARSVDSSVPLRLGEFTSAEYGITSLDPHNQPSMPDLDLEERQIALASLSKESRYARDERKRGVVIESLPCPLLVVTGEKDTAWPAYLYDKLSLKADRLSVPGASHWGLVLNRRALSSAIPKVCSWLEPHS